MPSKRQLKKQALSRNHDNSQQQFSINASLPTLRSMLSGNNTKSLNVLDQLSSDFGWPDTISFCNYYHMYEHHPLAKRGCVLPIQLGWIDYPEIIEGDEENRNTKETAWEKQTSKLFKNKKIFKALKSADTKQRVGHFSALLIQLRGDTSDGAWSRPVDKTNTNQIVKFIPVYEGQLTPGTAYPATDERYPMPMMYTFSESETTDETATNLAERSMQVHASRVITFSESADYGVLNGEPVMKAAYNALMDILKITGSSAEGLRIANAQKLVLKSLGNRTPNATEMDAINESIEEMFAGQGKSGFIGGMDIHAMPTNLPSSIKDIFMNAVNMVAAAFGIPATVLIGMQTGRLASDEDSQSMAISSNERRKNWQSEMVEQIIDWLDLYCTDYKKPEEISIIWSDLLEPSLGEKLDNLNKAVAAVKSYAEATQGELIGVDELRKIADYKATGDVLLDTGEDGKLPELEEVEE
jgi:hypothetical protein